MRFFIFFVLWLFFVSGFSQPVLNGKVVDANNKEPLAFVNIAYGTHQGVTTSIDGLFSLPVTHDSLKIIVSFIGYKQRIFTINKQDVQHFKVIYLQPETYHLQEVKVLPGKNPADRIINQVVANRKVLDPEKHLKSFAYKSYNKMYFTVKTQHNESLAKDTIQVALDFSQTKVPDSLSVRKKDTAKTSKMEAFLKKRHLLMMETVSQRYFKAPDKDFEEVTASKVSGFAMPTFVILATQLQSFSFYKTQLNLLDNHYLSPISKGSPQSYLFILKDTLYVGADTVFIIAFRPHKGKNFDGLKGLLYIKTPDYAIQNVIAEPMEQGDFFIKIQQQYEKVQDKQWIPAQLNADLVFNNLLVSDSGGTGTSLVGVNKTYLYDIKLNPELDSVKFSGTAFKVDKKAFKQPDSLWQQVRVIPLNDKEQETYRFIDSLGRAKNFDTKFRFLKLLTTGKIPFHFVNIDILKILSFNEYEGFRPQLGLETNDKIAEWFILGGYLAYGIKDKDWKYGGALSFVFSKEHNLGLKFSYHNDVLETGGLNFYDYKPNFSSTEFYRGMFVNNMYKDEAYRAGFSFRVIRYLKGSIFVQKRFLASGDTYRLMHVGNNITVSYPQLSVNETGIQFRYAYKEKQAKMMSEIFSLGTKYPVVWFNFTKGVLWQNIGIDYTKMTLQATKHFEWKKLGITNLKLTGGRVDGQVPVWLQFNANAAYYPFSVEVANSFATMRMNEFFSDRFAAFYFEHNFKSLLLKTRFFAPQIKVVYHTEFGTMKNSEQHDYFQFKTLDKGYHEAGLVINNILRSNLSGIGIGGFYRFGPYGFNKFKDNLAIKTIFVI
ncbi:MAG: carboxypeptidase-like regulatory domain-containing protein [Bacteroidales bacterium]|nr:carboxypeptidase-like regulatory domain-containing protein [Bacteroidales bacterium]